VTEPASKQTDIEQAVRILRTGGLVAFPTETVYGLGADARSSHAVQRIFRAKGRPPTNPLIVHVAGVAMAKLYAMEWPDTARRLAQKYWPGPLTLVLPRYRTIVPEVSAGLDTVGLRMPNHPLALQLIQRFDGPIAAPSANRSNHLSPTTAQHVREELGDAVDLVLDGGPCKVGIESTVLDLTGKRPRILRPGGVTRAQIEKVVGPVDDAKDVVTEVTTPASSPGQHETHYSPRAPAYRFTRDQLDIVLRDAADVDRDAPGILFFGETPVEAREIAFNGLGESPTSPRMYARQLYRMLRELDQLNPNRIFVEMPPDDPDWVAVRDRLTRATRPLSQLGVERT
jgi:L-threonylcarbamoyladenylate synthase